MFKTLSIIIPTLNEEKNILNILDDLKQQSLQPDEIIVVDGGSQDLTAKLLKKQKHVTFFQTKSGTGHQRNFGGEQASGTYFLYLDADTRITHHQFLEKLLSWAQAHQVETVCPYYVPYRSTVIIAAIYLVFDALFFLFQKISPSGAGSCILTTKKIFGKSGGFDQNLVFDDIAYIRAAAKHGSFGMAPFSIFVSDRRFKKYGSLRMLAVYMVLSIFFLFGLFQAAERVKYSFGEY
jgi:4,4'-diaponeurosporenoate glycosyltransferase